MLACFQATVVTDALLDYFTDNAFSERRSRERTNFAISTIIRNAHPDARVIAAENDKAANSQFRKLYLLGDQGPIKHAKAEADQTVD